MKKNSRVYIGLAVIVIAMGMLFLGGFDSDNMIYSYTVKEVLDQSAQIQGQGLRIAGRVIPGTVVKDHENVSVRFEIRDIVNPDNKLVINYEGILPDTFKEDQDLLVEGKFDGKNTVAATKIMTKCASKYEAEF